MPNSPYNGYIAKADGITVFVERDDGKVYSLTCGGMSTVEALREICEQIDFLPGNWRVTCISSPSTIHRDLQGDRRQRATGDKTFLLSEGSISEVVFAEPSMLGRVGRRDLWRGP